MQDSLLKAMALEWLDLSHPWVVEPSMPAWRTQALQAHFPKASRSRAVPAGGARPTARPCMLRLQPRSPPMRGAPALPGTPQTHLMTR